VNSVELPPNIPQEFADSAFFAKNGEAAWSLSLAAMVTKWLGENGYAILGSELWVIKSDGMIVSLPIGSTGLPEVHGNTVERENGEQWAMFTLRSAADTTAYLNQFNPNDIKEEGELRFNICWVSEAEFENLRTR
jgi:hypothetical protein